MSTIYVKISSAPGEASEPAYQNQIQCMSMRHAIVLPVVSATSRVEGTSIHGPITLTHRLDKASPILRQAVLKATNLGAVEINRVQNIGNRSTAVETIKLTNARCVRVDTDTLADEATRELSDELLETFQLDYEDGEITWSHKKIVGDADMGSVAGGWSISSQQTV